MISTIIFDLNKTLITYENHDCDDEYLELTGLTEDGFWGPAKHHFHDYCLGKCDADEVFARMLGEHGLSEDLAPKLKELHIKTQSPVKGMPELVEELKQKGCRLILLAGDGLELTEEKMSVFGKRELFDKEYVTSEMEVSKQEPRAYLKLLDEEGLRAEECVFVDDLKKHCRAADQVGIFSLLFTDALTLRRQLEKLRVL
ncbi:MAG: HAD-IA family hydrolase [Candidatus Woesearchaeota archaeon]